MLNESEYDAFFLVLYLVYHYLLQIFSHCPLNILFGLTFKIWDIVREINIKFNLIESGY